MNTRENLAVNVIIALRALSDGEPKMRSQLFMTARRCTNAGKKHQGTMRCMVKHGLIEDVNAKECRITERGVYVLDNCPSIEPDRAKADFKKALTQQAFCGLCRRALHGLGRNKYHANCRRSVVRERAKEYARKSRLGILGKVQVQDNDRCYARLILNNDLPGDRSALEYTNKHMKAAGLMTESGKIIWRGKL